MACGTSEAAKHVEDIYTYLHSSITQPRTKAAEAPERALERQAKRANVRSRHIDLAKDTQKSSHVKLKKFITNVSTAIKFRKRK